jgi:hypothetical protein
MTSAHDTVRLLNEFYTTAVLTGLTTATLHYSYIADEIHKTIRLVMGGADPDSCQRDLVNVLLADADQTPDERYANISRGWAYALAPQDEEGDK